MKKIAANDPLGHLSLANTAWVTSKKYLYLSSLALPLVPILSAYIALKSGNGAWFWLFVVFFYLIFPFIDHLMGDDPANPNEDLFRRVIEGSILCKTYVFCYSYALGGGICNVLCCCEERAVMGLVQHLGRRSFPRPCKWLGLGSRT